jgi:hypothetical protein
MEKFEPGKNIPDPQHCLLAMTSHLDIASDETYYKSKTQYFRWQRDSEKAPSVDASCSEEDPLAF